MSRCALSDELVTAVPPAIAVTPSGSMLFRGEAARLEGLLLVVDPIVLLAFAAPVLAVVFAVSIIFLKKPLFFAFGAERPPKMPAFSNGLVVQSATGVGAGCVAWLEW